MTALATTGSNSLFYLLLAVLLIVMGVTLYRLAHSRPRQVLAGNAPVKGRRFFRRK